MKPLLRLAWLMPVGLMAGVVATWVSYGPDAPMRLGGIDPSSAWVADLLAGCAVQVSGIAAWTRVPSSRIGPLLFATGVTWFIGNLASSDVGWVADAAEQLRFLYRAFLIHALLTYPTGRITSTGERFGIGVGYLSGLLPPLWQDPLASVLLAGTVSGLSVHRFQTAVGPLRRARSLPAYIACALASLVTVMALGRWLPGPTWAADRVVSVAEVALATAAILLSIGVAMKPRPSPVLADLLVRLTHGKVPGASRALSGFLGDPGLDVGYWDPEVRAFITERGSQLSGAAPGVSRTALERDHQPVAIVTHGPELASEHALAGAVATAVRLTSTNDQLRAELARRVEELEASRRRLLESGDEAARRLDAQIRAGPMRHIERIHTALGEIDDRTRSPRRTRDAVERARAQADATLDDLSLLARGVRPPAVAEFGLAGALARLVARRPFAVQLEVPANVPDDVMTDVWFICSEAITNVEKHGHARNVSVSVEVSQDVVLVDVTDDGVGGATVESGGGLQGILDRVVAHGGSATIASPARVGTHLRIVMPTGPVPAQTLDTALLPASVRPGTNTPASTDAPARTAS